MCWKGLLNLKPQGDTVVLCSFFSKNALNMAIPGLIGAPVAQYAVCDGSKQ